MLNKIMLLCLFLALGMGCQSASEVKTEAEKDKNQVNKVAVVQTAARDTTPERRAVQSRRIMTDRARQVEQIDDKFPFDIPLENPDLKVAASHKVLPNNGKPTVVLFWLTTCYPCRLEMKAIKDKFDDWKQKEDFNIVAISTDWDRNVEQFSKMAKEEGWPWPAYRDLNREFRKILPGGLNGLPQTFIFDGAGEIAYHSRKYRSGDEDKLFTALQKINKN